MNTLYKVIPIEYITTYHKLVHALVDYGKDMLEDCKADCCNKNVNINKARTIFNLALYLYHSRPNPSSSTEQSDYLISIVDDILEALFKGTPTLVELYSDTDNTVKFYITVGEQSSTIEVLTADYEAYQELYDIN